MGLHGEHNLLAWASSPPFQSLVSILNPAFLTLFQYGTKRGCVKGRLNGSGAFARFCLSPAWLRVGPGWAQVGQSSDFGKVKLKSAKKYRFCRYIGCLQGWTRAEVVGTSACWVKMVDFGGCGHEVSQVQVKVRKKKIGGERAFRWLMLCQHGTQ